MGDEPLVTESRTALRELIELLEEIDERWCGPEWMVGSEDDVAQAHRALMHLLQGGLYGHFERDPARPDFRPIVSPTRKFTGDNPDAVYHEAPVRGDLTYVVRGNRAGAVYVSITVEAGKGDGSTPESTAGAISDREFDVADDGSFEIHVGGSPRDRNWLALPDDAMSLTTRHYFEGPTPAAPDLARLPVDLTIEPLDDTPITPPPSDRSVAEGIRRVANFVRSRSLDMGPPGTRDQPAFVSTVPNEFPPPVKPGSLFLSFVDAAYSMAPCVLGPDEAMVITGRWPDCVAAYVCVWNRWQQTLDYVNRPVGLNRTQTHLEEDGSYRIVLAHRDPGVPNWLDTEGRSVVMLFWRFVLPTTDDLEPPRATVVPFDEVAGAD